MVQSAERIINNRGNRVSPFDAVTVMRIQEILSASHVRIRAGIRMIRDDDDITSPDAPSQT